MSTEQAARPGRALPGWAPAAWTPPAWPSVRDAAIAVVITVVGVVASYSEAHPSPRIRALVTPPDYIPHTPTAALLLVAAAGAALAWRRRYPRVVVCASTAFVVAYTLRGYVNGAALLLPAIALVTL